LPFVSSCGARADSATRERGYAPVTLTRHGRGQAVVEFAIVLPVVALIFASVVQFAFIFERQIGIENAIREASRTAAALPTDDSNAATNAAWAYECLIGQTGDPSPPDTCGRHLLQTNVQSYSVASVANLTVCYDNGSIADASGNGQILVTVTIAYRHLLFVPIVSGILDGIDGTQDGALQVTATSTFHVENAEDTSVALTTRPVCNA
jgi:Flp pilus assembly protein TadG